MKKYTKTVFPNQGFGKPTAGVMQLFLELFIKSLNSIIVKCKQMRHIINLSLLLTFKAIIIIVWLEGITPKKIFVLQGLIGIR